MDRQFHMGWKRLGYFQKKYFGVKSSPGVRDRAAGEAVRSESHNSPAKSTGPENGWRWSVGPTSTGCGE